VSPHLHTLPRLSFPNASAEFPHPYDPEHLSTFPFIPVPITCLKIQQAKSLPTSLTLSPTSTHFSTLSLPDRQVRIFSFLTGRKTRQYDESLQAIQEMQQAGTAVFRMDDMEFGRRLAVERELEKVGAGIGGTAWDETGGFLLYPTMLGIKG
jgi:peptidylprolyl isomerase domain and WD repeat-containing protein 1